MQKKPIIWLTLTLSVLLTVAVACGPATSTHNPTASNNPTTSVTHPIATVPTASNNSTTSVTHPVATVPVGENLYVLDGYPPSEANSIGGQHIIAFHPRSTNPTTLLTLPTGLTSQDHQRLYTATAKDGQTTITIINTQTGATMHSFVIAGTYSIAEQDFANSVSSADGRWLALRQSGWASNQATIALVDTQAGKLVKTIQLNGNFSPDAISPHGGIIYLLQYFNDGSNHYYVKAYDTRANQLLPAVIADKGESPRMVGTALTRIVPQDGSFAYTLYINTQSNMAFVHILPLADKPEPGGSNQLPVPQFARCIDLQVGKSPDLLRYYTLALSPDGTTLYAANGALGAITAIGLNNDEYNVIAVNIALQNTFDPGRISMTSSDQTRMLHNGAVLSADGSTLYFTGVRGIWAVDTHNLGIKRNYLTQDALTGVGFSADGRTLYAVDPAHGISLVDVATGQVQQTIQGPVHAPWGIEWVTN